MRIGIHTDNYRHEDRSLDYCLDSIKAMGATICELNMLEGYDLFQGHCFGPNISMNEDPLEFREKIERRGLKASCVDAHYPLWSYRCIEHMRKAILFADGLGVDCLATTDAHEFPHGMDAKEAFNVVKYHIGQVLPWAERHKVIIGVEPHGQLTNDPDMLMKIVTSYDSEYLKINFDTANTFIRGHEPHKFLEKVISKVHHCHVKDVSKSLADAARGKDTGIASSHVAVGEGVNAPNIIECLKVFKKHNFKGVLCIETHGEARSKTSFEWLSKQVKALV